MTEAVVKKSSRFRSVIKFVKDTRQELKKVIWPNRKQLTNNTLTVFAFCIIIGAIIWIFDSGITYTVVDRFLNK